MKAGVSLREPGGDGGGRGGGKDACSTEKERTRPTREMKTREWRGTFVFGGVQPFHSKITRRTRLRSRKVIRTPTAKSEGKPCGPINPSILVNNVVIYKR